MWSFVGEEDKYISQTQILEIRLLFVVIAMGWFL